MKFFKFIPILFIFFGYFSNKNTLYAEVNNPNGYRVLSNESKNLGISNVEYYIKQGDKSIKNDDFEAFGIRMNSSMEKLFNEASNKARNDCGRIARPSEWLVFLVSSSDMDILNIQKCHSNVFKSFSDEV